MARPLCHEPELTANTVTHTGFGIGHVSNSHHYLIHREKHVLLAVDGDFVEVDAMRARLAAKGKQAQGWELPKVLLHLFLEYGAEAFCSLNGMYVIAVFDYNARRLTLVNGRYGFRKLFYSVVEGCLYFGSEIKALVALPEISRTIDPVSLNIFMRMTYYVRDHTLYRDIKRIAPASIMTWFNGQVQVRPYEGLRFSPRDPRLTKREVYAETARLLRQAVERRLAPHTCLLLTGGLDSRSIAGAVDQLGRPPFFEAATLGHAKTHDVEFGSRIAGAIEAPFTYLPVRSSYLRDYGDRAVRRMEGMVSLHGCWHVAPDRLIRNHHLSALMTGSITMGVRSTAHRLARLPERYTSLPNGEGFLRWEFEHHMAGGVKETELERILKPAYWTDQNEVAYRAILETWREAPTDDVASKVDYATLREYERRYIAVNFDMLGALAPVTIPFLDNDLVDYTFATRATWPLGPEEYSQLVVAHFPKVARVPKTHTNIPPVAGRLEAKARKAWMRFYHKALPPLSLGYLGGHNYGAYVHHDEWLRSGSRNFAEQTLLKNSPLEGIVEMDAVRAIVRNHMAGLTDDYPRICLLLSLALWLNEAARL